MKIVGVVLLLIVGFVAVVGALDAVAANREDQRRLDRMRRGL